MSHQATFSPRTILTVSLLCGLSCLQGVRFAAADHALSSHTKKLLAADLHLKGAAGHLPAMRGAWPVGRTHNHGSDLGQ